MSESYAQLHPVNDIITAVLFESAQDDPYIADELLPPVDVSAIGRTGTLMIENPRNYLGDPDISDLRAPGADRQHIQTHVRTTTTFACEIRGLEHRIPSENINDSQFPGEEEMRQALILQSVLFSKKETRAANFFFSGAPVWATVAAAAIVGGGAVRWNAADSTPLVDLDAVQDTVRTNYNGVMGSDLVLPHDTANAIRRNLEVRGYQGAVAAGLAAGGDRVMSTEAMTAVVLRQVQGLRRVHIFDKVTNTAKKGSAIAVGEIATDQAWIGTLDPSGVARSQNGVRVSRTAGLALSSMPWVSGTYQTPGDTNRAVWMEQHIDYVAIDLTGGMRITDTLV